MKKVDVSIIICVYNAGPVLVDTIRHLTKLITTEVQNLEVIFVDNNSTDNSCEIIKQTLQGYNLFDWRIVKEVKSGLTFARLKGISEAKYDLLLFCDQDNLLYDDYLSVGLNLLEKDAKIAVLGGFGIAKAVIELPNWFAKNKIFYAVGEQMIYSGQVKSGHYAVYGAGMFVRKTAFEEISKRGFRFFNTSRSGKNLASGEDTEMCMAFHIAGFKVWYNSEMKFHHVIETKKLNIDYLKKLKMGISQSRFVTRFYLDYINGYIPCVSRFFWLKEFIYSMKDLIISLFIKNNRLGIKRNYRFSMYLLSQRSLYNENVKNVISICKNLQNIETTK